MHQCQDKSVILAETPSTLEVSWFGQASVALLECLFVDNAADSDKSIPQQGCN
jgi:hypothetical protein